jgi:hypothetical protein
MVPLQPPNFKFRLFFIGLGFGISIFIQSSILCSSTPSSSKFPSISISPAIDPFQASSSHVNKPPLEKPKRSYDKSRVFQDTWAMQLPWA